MAVLPNMGYFSYHMRYFCPAAGRVVYTRKKNGSSGRFLAASFSCYRIIAPDPVLLFLQTGAVERRGDGSGPGIEKDLAPVDGPNYRRGGRCQSSFTGGFPRVGKYNSRIFPKNDGILCRGKPGAGDFYSSGGNRNVKQRGRYATRFVGHDYHFYLYYLYLCNFPLVYFNLFADDCRLDPFPSRAGGDRPLEGIAQNSGQVFSFLAKSLDTPAFATTAPREERGIYSKRWFCRPAA